MLVLPWLCWMVLALALRQSGRCWRDAIVLGAIGWGLAILGLSEIANIPSRVTGPTLTTLWVLLLAGLCSLALTIRPLRSWRVQGPPAAYWPRPERMPWLLLSLLVLLIAAVGVAAVMAAPNTFDTMTYHLPRVMHWLQNASLAPYSSLDERHVFMSPWPALAQLNFIALSGSDRLSNLVQWSCLAGGAVAASGIAMALGCGPRIQVATAVAMVSLPMAMLQGASSQSDFTAAFWVVCLAYCILRRWQMAQPDLLHILGGTVALGLAVLSKGTAAPIAAPLVLLWLGMELFIKRWQAWRLVLALALIPPLMHAPHAWRNYQAFSQPVTPTIQRDLLLNQAYAPNQMIANVVRGVASNLGTTHKPWNDAVNEKVLDMLKGLGVQDGDRQVSLNGQRFRIFSFAPKPVDKEGNGLIVLTWKAITGQKDGWKNLWELGNRLKLHEDLAPNPLHMGMMGLAMIGLLLGWRIWRQPALVLTGLAILLGFVLFCIQVKWQLWIMRLQLPFLALGSIWAMVLIGRWLGPRSAACLAWVLAISAIPFAIRADMRPLVGPDNVWSRDRYAAYFNQFGHLRTAYPELVKAVRDQRVQCLGIITNWSSPEYPLWTTFSQMKVPPPRIIHLQAPQIPRYRLRCYFPDDAIPDAVVVYSPPVARAREKTLAMRYLPLTIQGRSFEATQSWSNLVFYLPKPPPQPPPATFGN